MKPSVKVTVRLGRPFLHAHTGMSLEQCHKTKNGEEVSRIAQLRKVKIWRSEAYAFLCTHSVRLAEDVFLAAVRNKLAGSINVALNDNYTFVSRWFWISLQWVNCCVRTNLLRKYICTFCLTIEPAWMYASCRNGTAFATCCNLFASLHLFLESA